MAPGRPSVIRLAQWAAAIALVAYGLSRFPFSVAAIRATWQSLHPSASGIAASALVVLVAHVVLLEGWRRTMQTWGGRAPDFLSTARIWYLAGLARYIPGVAWQAVGMGVMAARAGVAPAVAAGSGLLMTLASVASGLAVALTTGASMLPTLSAARWVLVGLGVALLLASPMLIPRMLDIVKRVTGRQLELAPPPAGVAFAALAITALGHVLYGVAFWLLVHAVLTASSGALSACMAVYTAAYLAGFLTLVAPAGAGVRELSMIGLLQSARLATAPEALAIALLSRLVMTLLEIVPALALLPRDSAAEPTSTQAP